MSKLKMCSKLVLTVFVYCTSLLQCETPKDGWYHLNQHTSHLCLSIQHVLRVNYLVCIDIIVVWGLQRIVPLVSSSRSLRVASRHTNTAHHHRRLVWLAGDCCSLIGPCRIHTLDPSQSLAADRTTTQPTTAQRSTRRPHSTPHRHHVAASSGQLSHARNSGTGRFQQVRQPQCMTTVRCVVVWTSVQQQSTVACGRRPSLRSSSPRPPVTSLLVSLRLPTHSLVHCRHASSVRVCACVRDCA